MDILFIDTTDPYLWDTLVGQGHNCTLDNTSAKKELQQSLHMYDGFIIRSRFKIDREFIDAGTKLKFIARVGAGLENIDCEYAASKGIKLISAPEGNRQAVGEHAVGMLLALMRNILVADSEVRHGKWIREGNRGYEINGRTVGIIGYGNIGKAVEKAAAGLNMNVLVYTRTVRENGVTRFTDFDTLLKNSDIITLHCPFYKQSENMMNEEAFSKCKRGAVFINTSRGGTVDETALLSAFKSGRLSGAAIDVLKEEPMSEDCVLADAPNIIITPHTAWAPLSTRRRLLSITCENIDSFLNGKSKNRIV